MSTAKTPWKDHMGDVPMHLDYFEGSMAQALEQIARKYPKNIALDFMGSSTSYAKVVENIHLCAKSLKAIGIAPGDKVTIAMPNCPQSIYLFYAINLIGGIAIDTLVAGIDEGRRSFKIVRAKPDGKSYARDIADKYGLSLDKIMTKISK